MKKTLSLVSALFIIGCTEEVPITIDTSKIYSLRDKSCYIPYYIQNTLDDKLAYHVSLIVGNKRFTETPDEVSSGNESKSYFYTRFRSSEECDKVKYLLENKPEQVEFLKFACEVKNYSEKDCKETLTLQINPQN